jgi:hypothetical protein
MFERQGYPKGPEKHAGSSPAEKYKKNEKQRPLLSQDENQQAPTLAGQ